MAFLLDSNVISELCRRRNPRVRRRFEEALGRGERIFLSSVALYEVRRYLLWRDARAQLRFLDALMERLGVEEISWRMWDSAAALWADLRRKGRTLGPEGRLDGDALLSAQAEALSATVATRNIRHFKVIGVPAEDWTI